MSLGSALRSSFTRRLLALCCLLPAIGVAGQATESKAEQNSGAAHPSSIDPKAQQLLDRAIQALGGQAFLQAKNVSIRGRTFAIADGVTTGFAPFESTVAYPDKRRFSYGKDKPVTLINDGERGWQLDRYGMVRQPAEQVRRWQISARYGYENLLRQVIREPGLLIQDAGRDFTDNLASRVMDITDARQVQIRLYVHAVTSLPIRVSYRIQNPESREWDEYAEVYSDYRKIQNIQTPLHVTRYLNGERYSEVFRNTAQYNVEVSPNYFAPGG